MSICGFLRKVPAWGWSARRYWHLRNLDTVRHDRIRNPSHSHKSIPSIHRNRPRRLSRSSLQADCPKWSFRSVFLARMPCRPASRMADWCHIGLILNFSFFFSCCLFFMNKRIRVLSWEKPCAKFLMASAVSAELTALPFLRREYWQESHVNQMRKIFVFSLFQDRQLAHSKEKSTFWLFFTPFKVHWRYT